jgi:hypothetical protein
VALYLVEIESDLPAVAIKKLIQRDDLMVVLGISDVEESMKREGVGVGFSFVSSQLPLPVNSLEVEGNETKSLSSIERIGPGVRNLRLAAAQDVFDFWKKTLEKRDDVVFSAQRLAKVKARIREGYTVERLKLAISGCAKSPFHMGENPTGTIYDDLTLIMRDASKVDMFIALAETSKSGSKTAPPQGFRKLADDEDPYA